MIPKSTGTFTLYIVIIRQSQANVKRFETQFRESFSLCSFEDQDEHQRGHAHRDENIQRPDGHVDLVVDLLLEVLLVLALLDDFVNRGFVDDRLFLLLLFLV